MLLTPEQMRAFEENVFASGIDAESLMDKAGHRCARAIRQFCPRPGTAIIFVAKGHNGGDALVVARHLLDGGWRVTLRFVGSTEDLRPLTRKKLEALKGEYDFLPAKTNAPVPHAIAQIPQGTPVILIDGMLGIGATGGLSGPYKAAARHFNELRSLLHATAFAIDVPTGLDGTSGNPDPEAVVADVTLTVAQLKTGLVADAATPFVGRLVTVPLADLASPEHGDRGAFGITPRSLRHWLPRRASEMHKGDAGRVAVVAGSRGFAGAAALAAAGAVRGGAGLVTLYVPEDIYPVVAGMVMPEVMVRPADDYRAVLEHGHDALAIGPGLGSGREGQVLELVERFAGPALLDADALNILARENALGLLDRPGAGTRVLTPHPGEMARLLKGADVGDRRECAFQFTEAHPRIVLVLKGARTLVASAAEPIGINTSGTPGMASGGMGDVLAGICAALAAPHHDKTAVFHAACLAVWTHARSAERAVFTGRQSIESLCPSDVLHHLGGAFDDVRRGVF